VPVYELSGVGHSFWSGDRRVTALADVDLVVRPGELVAVSGASGSGKSTLLRLLRALEVPTEGVVRCLGYDLSQLSRSELSRLRRERLASIHEQADLISMLTVAENVEAAIAHWSRATRRRRADELLRAVGLAHRAGRVPSRLSAGERHRVAIARALANAPAALLADEPTRGLDARTGAEILELVCRLSTERGQTVVLATRDPAVTRWATRTVVLRDGLVVEDSAVS
jgi:ABC-type lipoprotein export system ATPase subunit